MEGSGPDNEPTESRFIKFSKYAAIGLEFPSMVAGGLFLGYLLDRYWGTSPWFASACTLLALVGAFLRLVQWARRFSREKT